MKRKSKSKSKSKSKNNDNYKTVVETTTILIFITILGFYLFNIYINIDIREQWAKLYLSSNKNRTEQ